MMKYVLVLTIKHVNLNFCNYMFDSKYMNYQLTCLFENKDYLVQNVCWKSTCGIMYFDKYLVDTYLSLIDLKLVFIDITLEMFS